jgi:hypothetical protein
MALIKKLAVGTAICLVPNRYGLVFVGRNSPFTLNVLRVAMATAGAVVGFRPASTMKPKEMGMMQRRPKIQQKNQVAGQNPSKQGTCSAHENRRNAQKARKTGETCLTGGPTVTSISKKQLKSRHKILDMRKASFSRPTVLALNRTFRRKRVADPGSCIRNKREAGTGRG